MKVKDIVKIANITTTKVDIKETLSTSIFNGTFGNLAEKEDILNRKVNSFRIYENKMILFVK